jgi:hypothetical protein
MNFSRMVIFKCKNSSQKRWEAFSEENKVEKFFPEPSKQGNFSRRQTSVILWNIHP